MIKCRVIDFDGQELGHVATPFVPEPGDMLTLLDKESKPVGVMVHSRHMGTVAIDPEDGQEVNPFERAVNDIVVVVYSEAATIPDHDYKRGGYVPNKYKVIKQDGTPTDPAANYFVLRLDTDPNALMALKVYADSVESGGNRLLADDLRNILKDMRELQKRNATG